MSDNDVTGSSAPEGDGTLAAATPAVAAETVPVSTFKELELRFKGQTAKVNEVSQQRDALAAEIAALKAGQVSADDSLKQANETLAREIADLRAQIVTQTRANKYPKAAQRLDKSLGAVSEEELADLEATLNAAIETAPVTQPNPKPVPANAPNSDGDPIRSGDRDSILKRLAREVQGWS